MTPDAPVFVPKSFAKVESDNTSTDASSENEDYQNEQYRCKRCNELN